MSEPFILVRCKSFAHMGDLAAEIGRVYGVESAEVVEDLRGHAVEILDEMTPSEVAKAQTDLPLGAGHIPIPRGA